ncbi:MAG TPA: NADPH-dependent FMN reductase [Pyrinomonadaceae bacterium]|nr:NADPH-dependent FMN reductase [Pyrinomonadaceae bacterium]
MKVAESLADREITVRHWNLREAPLPIADPEFHNDPAQHADPTVREFVTVADSCDAFVLSSPIYHNSYSGVLKNALDHLAIAQFYYKPVGLLSHGGNRSPQAVDHLRIVVRGLLGFAITTHVCTGSSDYRNTDDGSYELKAEEILSRIERFTTELVMLAQTFRVVRQNLLSG